MLSDDFDNDIWNSYKTKYKKMSVLLKLYLMLLFAIPALFLSAHSLLTSFIVTLLVLVYVTLLVIIFDITLDYKSYFDMITCAVKLTDTGIEYVCTYEDGKHRSCTMNYSNVEKITETRVYTKVFGRGVVQGLNNEHPCNTMFIVPKSFRNMDVMLSKIELGGSRNGN